mgnify:CR=1 FL=1
MMSTFSNPPSKTQAHTVLIVEPDSYWRKVHSMDVSRDGTFEVLCAVRNKRQAVAFLSRLPVDFIVTNSMLPDGNPADIIRFAQKRNPDCLVLAASDCEDANIVMQTITSGANGYVLFSDKTTNLCSCLRVLQAGGSPPRRQYSIAIPTKSGKSAPTDARKTSSYCSGTRHTATSGRRRFVF